ncbi:piggyBac transposable element-derived protein 3-like [Schistocerca gregaria]|uniref:piggyBac transposable element-derived protein 3-like n=1 Tax=Schistocerca gregaria TaxID=7010 RepID=UPI00211F25A7|nr:piggyBac transposable element-derived protein 3-like [Schistocerca gregaria]
MHWANETSYNQIADVMPLYQLKNNFLITKLEEYNSIEELIIPLKSHTSLRHSIKSKPHKWGINVFAQAGVSGYIYDSEMYFGKGTNTASNPELGMSGNVVIRLIRNLPRHTSFKLFIDNWFTSLNLAVKLRNEEMYVVGTIRKNRLGGCRLKTDTEMKKECRGTCDYRRDEKEIIILKWYYNKTVHLISTYKGKEPVENVECWSKNSRVYIDIPHRNIV